MLRECLSWPPSLVIVTSKGMLGILALLRVCYIFVDAGILNWGTYSIKDNFVGADPVKFYNIHLPLYLCTSLFPVRGNKYVYQLFTCFLSYNNMNSCRNVLTVRYDITTYKVFAHFSSRPGAFSKSYVFWKSYGSLILDSWLSEYDNVN